LKWHAVNAVDTDGRQESRILKLAQNVNNISGMKNLPLILALIVAIIVVYSGLKIALELGQKNWEHFYITKCQSYQNQANINSLFYVTQVEFETCEEVGQPLSNVTIK